MSVSTSTSGNGASKPSLGIRFSWDAQYDYSTGVGLRGHIVELGVDYQTQQPTWLNISSSAYEANTAYHGLQVYTMLYNADAHQARWTSGHECEYRSVFAADLERAKNMVSVLTKVGNGLNKMTAADGRPTSFGQYAARVARILGATKIIFDDSLSLHGGREMSPGDAIDVLNLIVDHWRETGLNKFSPTPARSR